MTTYDPVDQRQRMRAVPISVLPAVMYGKGLPALCCRNLERTFLVLLKNFVRCCVTFWTVADNTGHGER